MPTLRIATRRSPLARWQADAVAARLQAEHPGLEIEILPMVTKADQMLDSPLSRIGGKGLFIKELEHALLDGRADIAVHSMKDVPAEFPSGLGLGAILEREDPRDALLGAPSLQSIRANGVVGTASLRRSLQVRAGRPDVSIKLLRGNIQTRMRKLADGEFDAILLAAAGLKRMDYGDRIDHILEPDEMLPAIGQGALGIECRLDDAATRERITPLIDAQTTACVEAERAVGHQLGGNCQLPIAAYARIAGERLQLSALIGQPDGQLILRASGESPPGEGPALGQHLGEQLRADGGDHILADLSATS